MRLLPHAAALGLILAVGAASPAWAGSARAPDGEVPVTAPDGATIFRVFLTDGTSLVSYGEPARVGDRIVLISVGGIETADDAWDRITSGASLLQGYTGFIYGGGLWAKHIHDGLARKLHEGGFTSLADAVGSAAR